MDYNIFHFSEIYNQLKDSYGDNRANQWRDYVRFYSNKEAKTKFNADTAITYSLALTGGAYVCNPKYNHREVLLLQKNGQGFFYMYCFYDDVAAKNFNKYRKTIEKMFRYKDGAVQVNDEERYG